MAPPRSHHTHHAPDRESAAAPPRTADAPPVTPGHQRAARPKVLLLAGAFAGPLTAAGCTTAPEEAAGAEGNGGHWEQGDLGQQLAAAGARRLLYTFMASAAAAAYPARFEENTRIYPDNHNLRSLRSLQTMTIDSDLTDGTKVTTFIDGSNPGVARMIIAFRGTVHPTVTAPLSNWTDVVVDLTSVREGGPPQPAPRPHAGLRPGGRRLEAAVAPGRRGRCTTAR